MVVRGSTKRAAPSTAAAAPVVRGQAIAWWVLGLSLAQLAAGKRKLDPQTAAKMYLALVGVVVAGIGLLAVIALWGGRLRRLSRARPRSQVFPRDAWAKKPLVPPQSEPPATND